MNFTTDLPKKDPIVSYIVASAIKCEKFFPGSSKEGPVYRMHAVILTNYGSPNSQSDIRKQERSPSFDSLNKGVS